MALASSGTMSIGGTTTDRSINVELGRSATATSSMGETDLRTLAGVASGAIGMDDFYGASSVLWTPTISTTSRTIGLNVYTGYGFVGPNSLSIGATNDATCDLYTPITGSDPSWEFYSVDSGNTFFRVLDTESSPIGNAGWTTLKIYNGTDDTGTLLATKTRTSLTYSNPNPNLRMWDLGANYSPASVSRHLVFS